MFQEIRSHIENESLSFIVGAGFSRNISNEFPLWGELLSDLVLEMYPKCKSEDMELQAKCIRQKISELGYLGVASEYVRRKGYHEAIDLYIEKRIPYLKPRSDGGYDLMKNEQLITSAPSLECHQMLLALNPRHIFTFNYDNCLDVLGKAQASIDLQKQEADTKAELRLLRNNLDDFIRAYKELQTTKVRVIAYDEFASSDDFQTQCARINQILSSFACHLKQINATNGVEELYKHNYNAIKTEEARLLEKLETCQEARKDKYQLVRNAFEISLTDGCKNIYKLHGSLRTDANEAYGFDGDKYKHYVITGEDYQEYPIKHEAFVNLMKISLLKGAFCLIGFSGDDPNFMTWINWVKGVLDRGAEDVSGSRPVYYVNSEDDHLPKDKELLLRNHYIQIVNLADIFPEAVGHRERMCTFFENLRSDKDLYTQYNSSWRNIKIGGDDAKQTRSISEDIEKVYLLSDYNLVPEQSTLEHYRRRNILSSREKIFRSDMDRTICAKLFYSAIRGELLPINTVLTPLHIKILSRQTLELKCRYETMRMRASSLSGELVENWDNENNVYESLLSLLFHLKFGEAKARIKSWEPDTGIGKMRRFLLLSAFAERFRVKEIANFLREENFACPQHYKFALDILPRIRGIVTNTERGMSLFGDLQPKIDTLTRKHPYLVQLSEVMDNLLDDIKGKHSIQPYGDIKQSVCFNSYNVALINSIKLLQILLEFGIPVKTHHVLMLDKEDWGYIYQELYEKYPYPCLYFSLQYGNQKDLLKKIAQDYISSYELKDILPKLLEIMLLALKDNSCPRNVKEAIYIVAPIFMKAVAAECWERLFEEIYDELLIEDGDGGRSRVISIHEFIITGVSLSESSSFRHKILLSNLRLREAISSFSNRLIISAAKKIELNDEERHELDHLCRVASKPVHLYVIMNLRQWVSKETIVQKLLQLSDEMLSDFTLLKAASEYAVDQPALQSRLKKLILGSQYLWQTGIDDDCRSVGHCGYTLEISDMQQSLDFAHQELVEIYERMKKAFDKVLVITRTWNDRNPWSSFMNDWHFILIEMQKFMRKNKLELSKQKEYTKYLTLITRQLNMGRGGNSIVALIVNDRMNYALEWLYDEFFEHGVQKYQHELMLVANRIINAKSEYLHSCFIHFGWVIIKYEQQFDKQLFRPILRSILETYKTYFSGQSETKWDVAHVGKDIAECELMEVYQVYKQWGGKSAFWDKYKARYSHL